MACKFLKSIIGVINVVLYFASSLILSSMVCVGGIIAWIIPLRWWRYHVMKLTLNIPVIWSSVTNVLLYFVTRNKWEIRGDATALNPKGWYVLISNHQTWADIPVLGYALNRKIPIFKFFMKKELLWSLPIVGFAVWVLGYPFMARHSREEIRKRPELKGKDIETAKKACHKFAEYPTTVINFIEGTRFREEKRERQQSPYKHLLKPKAAGIAVVINEIHDQLSGVLDVTIQYSEPNMTFWKLFSGNFEKAVISYELLPITEDLLGDYYKNREYRSRFQQWLNQLWEKKDQQLDQPVVRNDNA